jgi:hypothetical protein
MKALRSVQQGAVPCCRRGVLGTSTLRVIWPCQADSLFENTRECIYACAKLRRLARKELTTCVEWLRMTAMLLAAINLSLETWLLNEQ